MSKPAKQKGDDNFHRVPLVRGGVAFIASILSAHALAARLAKEARP